MIIGRDLSHSLFYKTVLVIVFGTSLVALVLLRYNASGQFNVTTLVGIFYILWGSLFHLHKRNLNIKVLGEYLSIGLLIIAVGFLLVGNK